jgi:hypothetical protein
VVRLPRARYPSAVLPPGYPPSGGGFTAWVFWTSAKQTNANVIRTGGMIVFISGEVSGKSRQLVDSIRRKHESIARQHNSTIDRRAASWVGLNSGGGASVFSFIGASPL